MTRLSLLLKSIVSPCIHIRPQLKLHDIVGFILILISSVLLGIWAVKGTIALRNILLVCGTLLSIFYIFQEWRAGALKEQLSFWRSLPFCLIGLIFIWVITHYFLFSIDPANQLHELKSTWFRVSLAVILGFATGLALRKYPLAIYLLWIAILASFIVVFIQYIPKAIAKQSLFAPDVFGYIFHVKINAVLMGLLCLAGLGGTLFDYFLNQRTKLAQTVAQKQLKRVDIIFFVLATSVIVTLLYSFVFIFDTKNGVIGSVLLLISWLFIWMKHFIFEFKNKANSWIQLWRSLLMISCLIIVVGVLLSQHSKVNHGWQSIIEDIKIGIQIDRYPHWKNLGQMGYPKNTLNLPVAANTYERVAWATAGLREIFSNPLGAGVLTAPYSALTNPTLYSVMSQERIGILSTHSAWIEFGLAFGLPFLALIFLTLIMLFFYLLKTRSFVIRHQA